MAQVDAMVRKYSNIDSEVVRKCSSWAGLMSEFRDSMAALSVDKVGFKAPSNWHDHVLVAGDIVVDSCGDDFRITGGDLDFTGSLSGCINYANTRG